jgi:putative hemolysin
MDAFTVAIAETETQLQAIENLRYQVFFQEQGKLGNGRDWDHYDPFCTHLYVVDNRTEAIIGTTRLLNNFSGHPPTGFYSESEFALEELLKELSTYRLLEIGRTCIAPAYRGNAAAIATLWQGLSRFILAHQVDYLMGCPSLALPQASAILPSLREKHAHPQWHIAAKTPWQPEAVAAPLPFQDWPPLLKAYVRLGAQVCSDGHWDPDFQVVDVFILAEKKRLAPRYLRHFLRISVQESLNA